MWLKFGNLKYLKFFFLEENSSKQVYGTQSIKCKADFWAYLRKCYVRVLTAFTCSVCMQWQV
jgi:hypothetical protein